MQRSMIALRILSLVAVPSALKFQARHGWADERDYCIDSRRLLLSEARMSENFLGGRGGGASEKPHDIVYSNVFDSINVDMVMTADDTYFGNPDADHAAGDLAMVNVAAGASVTIKLSFVDRVTGVPVTVPSFVFMIAGLGSWDDEEGGAKSVTIHGFDEYELSKDTFVTAAANSDDGTTTFASDHSVKRGVETPSHMALFMDPASLANAAMLKFPRISSFTMTLRVDEGVGDRDFHFGGVSNMVCEKRAFCGSMQCPQFYESKVGVGREYCLGENCTVEADLKLCCSPVTPTECSAETALTLRPESEEYANLGGTGPNLRSPPNIRYSNIFESEDGQGIDMVISNTSLYTPSSHNTSGLEGYFLMFDVAMNTSVDLAFDFVISGTDTPAGIPRPMSMGLFDFDMQANGHGVEQLVVSGFASYTLSANSSVHHRDDGAFTTFTATAVGTAADNPTDPFNQTQEQLDKTASIIYAKGTKHFDVTMRVRGGELGSGGRQIMLTGWTTLTCPKIGSYCSSTQCPYGYAPLPNFEKIRCVGEKCTSADVSVCCETIETGVCDNRERLQFTEIGLLHNNLGGAGPFTKSPQNVRIDDVFPSAAGPRTEMRISLPESGKYAYKPTSPPDNKLAGGFLQLEVMPGGTLDLVLKLKNSLSGEDVFKDFVLTVADINRPPGDAIVESVGATGYDFYNLSASTTLVAKDVDGAVTKFSADAYGPDHDQPGATMTLLQKHLARAVSFKYTNTSTVRLSLSVTGSEKNYRAFLIGGTSNLVCPTRLPLCTSMVCPKKYKLKPSAAALTCAGPVCDTEVDTDTCCDLLFTHSCDSSALELTSESLALSNLGGLGPDKGDAKLLFANVLPHYGRTVDLEVRNLTEYTPGAANSNSVRGGFGFISAAANTSTDLEFRFVDRSTGALLENMSEFMFSIVDLRGELDEVAGKVVGLAEVTVPQASNALLSDRTRLYSHGTTFWSSSWAAQPWTPSQPRGMDVVRMHDSVAITLNTSMWNLRVKFAPGSGDPRRLLFAGPTSLACPPRAYCDALKCPLGMELIPAASTTVCMGTVCTQEDVPKCCLYRECDASRALELETVLVNNLGGYSKGVAAQPGEPRRIIYGNVFPHSTKRVNLEISVPADSHYFAHDASKNGKQGAFGTINWMAGSHVDLNFHFRDAVTNEQVYVGSFFLTFTGIDMQKLGGRESVTVSDYLWYKTTTPSGLAMETSCSGVNTTFKATEAAGTENAAASHGLSMDEAHRNRSVTLLMPGTSVFKVTLRADPGWSGRNVLFTGQSNLVCGQRSSCLGVTCDPGFKLLEDANSKLCLGLECLKEVDHEICCDKDADAASGGLVEGDVPEGDTDKGDV